MINLQERKRKKKKNIPKIKDTFKARSKIGRYQNKERARANLQFAVHRFSQPRRFTMQYRGSPGWIRSREMDSPGRTLSFVLTFSEGTIHDRPTHTDNGFTIHWDGGLLLLSPLYIYKNRPAEISSRDGTLLFNSLRSAILGVIREKQTNF